jgi:hypothetical protein
MSATSSGIELEEFTGLSEELTVRHHSIRNAIDPTRRQENVADVGAIGWKAHLPSGTAFSNEQWPMRMFDYGEPHRLQ